MIQLEAFKLHSHVYAYSTMGYQASVPSELLIMS
jgi:formylmethanofuran dehydrogenase subunit E